MYMNEQLFQRPVTITEVRTKLSLNTHRLVVRTITLLAVVLVIGLFSLSVSLLAGDQDAFAASNNYPIQSVEVVSGDTLWDIANHYSAKGVNVRDYMYEIKRLNNLKSNMIHEGQVLLLP